MPIQHYRLGRGGLNQADDLPDLVNHSVRLVRSTRSPMPWKVRCHHVPRFCQRREQRQKGLPSSGNAMQHQQRRTHRCRNGNIKDDLPGGDAIFMKRDNQRESFLRLPRPTVGLMGAKAWKRGPRIRGKGTFSCVDQTDPLEMHSAYRILNAG